MKIRMHLVVAGTLGLLAFTLVNSAQAQAPALIPIQGILADDTGAPIDGDKSVQFALYAADLGGSPLYTETQTVSVAGGLFSIYLGDITALDMSIFRDNSVWLGVSIDGGVELSPRVQFATAPYAGYAAYAGDATTVGGVGAAGIASSTVGAGLSVNMSNEISVDRTQFDTWVTENIGAEADTNAMNHARYTDGEATTAVSAADTYVRNAGDTVTGPFVMSSTARVDGLLTAAGGIASQCNPGTSVTSTERVGTWCMTTRRRLGRREAAIQSCHAMGAVVCPLSAILACTPAGGTGNCVDDTATPDPGRSVAGILTGDYVVGTGVTARSVVYYSRDGSGGTAPSDVAKAVDASGATGPSFNYFCCSPALGI